MVDLRGPGRFRTTTGDVLMWDCASIPTKHYFRQEDDGPIVYLAEARELTEDETASVKSNECPLTGHPDEVALPDSN